MFIRLIINLLSATHPLTINSPSSIIVLPIDPEELIRDGIFLQVNGDDVFLQEFADGGVDNAGDLETNTITSSNLPYFDCFPHHFPCFDAENSFLRQKKNYLRPINNTRYARI